MTEDIEKKLDEMCGGDINITRMEQVTTWQRVLNAARRTIGRKPLEKEPTDSWKAKILLAEHSPIRLLEFDWTWEKIRQWVTAHLVRHHEGCEKFVHSQRADRRELPCERDRLPQGARNDMDMTANAQALISISRKRCCMCASKETREAWNKVKEEIAKENPVLASKMVRECVYRGFCPEWMSDCKYCYSPTYWLELAQYRNTIYGNDEEWRTCSDTTGLMVSNIGRVKDNKGNIIKLHTDKTGVYIDVDGIITYVRDLIDLVYGTAGKEYKDGNKYNNTLTNLI